MAKDFITPEQYQRGVGKIKNYVDQITNSTDIFEKPFIYDEESSTATKKYVNIKSLTKKTWYRVKNDDAPLSLTLYYPIPNTSDKFNICSLVFPKESNMYINSVTDTKASVYVKNFDGSYYITATFGDTLESCSKTKKISVPKLSNTNEFEPTDDYNLTSKKYVDEKFLTNDIETIITISKDELDKCNNGGRGIVCSQKLNILDHNASCIYYAYYGDKQIKMEYSSQFNQYGINNMDKNEDASIGLIATLKDNRICPYNSGVAAVKAYKFTNDLIIKRHRLLDPDKAVIKDTNKYVLITNDDTLIIKKDNITDIADATVTIDNLTGQFGILVANDNGTYSYNISTIMTDVETFTFKVNNIEQKLIIVPYKEMQYDDKNGGITYDSNWTIEENASYNGNSAHISIKENEAIISFNFKGCGIDIFGKTSSITGRCRAELYKGDTRLHRQVTNNGGVTSDYYDVPIFSFSDLDYDSYTIKISSYADNISILDYIKVYNSLSNIDNSIFKLYENKSSSQRSVLYINRKNFAYTPFHIYDPTTKKYVDDLVERSKTVMSTDEEVDSMLLEVLGGDYSGK